MTAIFNFPLTVTSDSIGNSTIESSDLENLIIAVEILTLSSPQAKIW